MHAGKVLAVGTAKELTQRRGMDKLEDAFIAYLEDAAGTRTGRKAGARPRHLPKPIRAGGFAGVCSPRGSICAGCGPMRAGRRWKSCAIRSGSRFSLVGPLILLVTVGYGISFDVEHLAYAAFDQDQTNESRELLENFSGSRYFTEHRTLPARPSSSSVSKSGELAVAIEIPPNFGKDLLSDKQPEVSVSLDGAMPFRAETAGGYVTGLALTYLADQAARGHISGLQPLPVNVEERFRYNQAFKSVYASIPGTIMLAADPDPGDDDSGRRRPRKGDRVDRQFPVDADHRHRIPARQATAVRRHRARQFPDASIDGDIPVRRAGEGIGCARCLPGSFIYIGAATAFGLLVSCFTSTQVAAIFTTTVLTAHGRR